MHDPVLVLNANFEPINVCNMHRAMGLILGGKADLVLDGRGFVHTISASYPRPPLFAWKKWCIGHAWPFV